MLKQELRGLEAGGQLLVGGLAYDAWTGKADHRLRLRQGNVAEGSEAGHDTGGRGVGQDSDVGKASLGMAGEGAACLGHLHEREHPLVHARPPGGTDNDHRSFCLRGGLDDPGDLLADHGSHGGGQKGKIHHGKPDGMAAHGSRTGDHGINQACLLPVGLEPLFVGGYTLEPEGIDSRHGCIRFLKGSLIDKDPDALHGPHAEMMVTLGADTQVLLDGEVVHHLGASGALRPETFRHFVPLLAGKLERRFSENGHGTGIVHQTGLEWEARHGMKAFGLRTVGPQMGKIPASRSACIADGLPSKPLNSFFSLSRP